MTETDRGAEKDRETRKEGEYREIYWFAHKYLGLLVIKDDIIKVL